MKKLKNIQFAILVGIVVALSSFSLNSGSNVKFPYQQAGLTERQAAAHLLSRFTFGAKPREVDDVVRVGLENWFDQQLNKKLPDPLVEDKLAAYTTLRLSNAEVLQQFPNGGELRQMAIKEGLISKDSIANLDKQDYKDQIKAFRKEKGFGEEKELFRQFINQKIIRACFSKNQLHEVLTDFWFNHFNVSITKNQCARFIPAYERDAIRPHVTGKFEDMLLATAKSPAMLLYLDNFSSMSVNEKFEKIANQKRTKRIVSKTLALNDEQMEQLAKKRKSQGLNENYAREVMELHTLGVDGGYTQTDVTEAARVLTGWTIYPISNYGAAANIKKVIERIGEERLLNNGFVHDGDFLFAMNRHDMKPKTVLGKSFVGKGYQEGVELLQMLAHHPSTAKFISKKLAVRFVSDKPSASLIDAMAKTFIEKEGNISEVLKTMVLSTEFWSQPSLRAKTKSPFEYAVSTIRTIDADVSMPFQLNLWITRMGQKLYFYQAPTGFPDNAQYWINAGSLLNRMNFGLALASKKIPGVTFDLASLNNNHEPESAEAALPIYAALMLPERNINPTILRLTPFVNHPDIQTNIAKASSEKEIPADTIQDSMTLPQKSNSQKEKKKESFGDHSILAKVVGIIIGSPEFQRR